MAGMPPQALGVGTRPSHIAAVLASHPERLLDEAGVLGVPAVDSRGGPVDSPAPLARRSGGSRQG